MAGGALDLDARLTATQAAAYAHVTVQAIVNWRTRGYGPKGNRRHLERGPDGKYRLLDVARAEACTSKRARRR